MENPPFRRRKMTVRPIKIFVSGCFDILHAGHVQFFHDALKLGYHLTVCFCSDKNLLKYKGRITSMPEDNKFQVLKAIRYVDKVVKGTDDGGIWDFVPEFLNPSNDCDTLAVTEDDKHIEEKRAFCEKHDRLFVVLPKRNLYTRVSTSEIRERIGA